MAKKKTPKTIHYVYDSGSGLVGQSLMRAKIDDFEKIFEHPEMSCFDLRGHLISLPLYEVPKEILDKLKLARLKGEMTFREFIQNADNLPTEVPEEPVEDSKERKKKGGAVDDAVSRLKELVAKRKRARNLRKMACAKVVAKDIFRV